jgi:TusA-related sulfurtransferase
MSDPKYDHYLDITAYVCPMTFVRTKLLLEKMRPGETAQVRLNAGEPLQNVPRSVREHGHEVVSLLPEDPQGDENGTFLLVIRKAGA